MREAKKTTHQFNHWNSENVEAWAANSEFYSNLSSSSTQYLSHTIFHNIRACQSDMLLNNNSNLSSSKQYLIRIPCNKCQLSFSCSLSRCSGCLLNAHRRINFYHIQCQHILDVLLNSNATFLTRFYVMYQCKMMKMERSRILANFMKRKYLALDQAFLVKRKLKKKK